MIPSRRNLIIHDVTGLSQSQETEVLTLDNHMATYWETLIDQVHHFFVLKDGQSKEPEKGLAH